MSAASSPSVGASAPLSESAAHRAVGPRAGASLHAGIDIRRSDHFGVGTYIRNLVRALARVNSGEEFVLVGSFQDWERFPGLPENFRFEEYTRRFDSVRSHIGLAMTLRRLGLDVFHMPHRWVPYLLPGIYVATLHDINNILFPAENHSRYAERIRRRILTHGLRRAARVIAVSEATKRDAVRHLGLAPSIIEVVPDAVDEKVAEPVTEEERQQTLARYQIDHPFVLYAGRIQTHKNIPRLVEAFAVVRQELENHPRYHDLRLIIIGDELTALPEVRHTVLRTRSQDRVRFLGFVPVETLRVFYDCAEAFLFPSLYEGFGLPPLEAMSHGTPVVTSSVSSLTETVGNAAVLVNPANVFDIARGLRQVLLDESYRLRLRERGFEQVRSFSWDRTARKVLAIYHAVARP